MAKRKAAVLKQFSVPMEISMRGRAVVEAADAEDAKVEAEAGNFDFQTNTAEMFDWGVTGEARCDE